MKITAKCKSLLFGIVSAEDFQFEIEREIDSSAILQRDNLSLYCLDHQNRRVLFVETPSTSDLLAAPFYFIAQYEQATKLVAVPYDTMHALAQTVRVDPQKIILFYSTGRCGSTLFSHVLNLDRSILSYAEPDVFTQLVKLRTAGQVDDIAATRLLSDSLLLMSGKAQQLGFETFAFKFRSYVLSVSDLLYQSLPQAQILFMYRHALTWANSFSRAFGVSDDWLVNWLVNEDWQSVIPRVQAHLSRPPHTISYVEYLANMWVSTMQDIQLLLAKGAPATIVRFEDLTATPDLIVKQAFEMLGLQQPDAIQLQTVLGKDSQAGTLGAQDRATAARKLSQDELGKFSQAITKLDPSLTPNYIL